MPWTGDKFYARSFEVVVRIVQRVDLKFAAVARSSIDMANAECAAKNSHELLLQRRGITSSAVGRWQSLGQ